MEQKQLDEIDESFFGEEILDEDIVKKAVKTKTAKNSSGAEKMAKKDKKTETEKADTKKTSKKNEAKKVEANTEKVKENTIKIEPVKETAKEEKKVKAPATDPVDPWADDASEESLFGGSGAWKFLTGLLIILLIVSVFTNGFQFGTGSGSEEISLSDAEELALDYVNSELLQAPFEAELESSEDIGELYRLTLSVAGQSIDSYITKDGELFFPQGFDLTAVSTTTVDSTEDSLDAGDPNAVPVDDDPVKGDDNAPITIVEFSDFECPFCGRFWSETYSDLVENYVDTGKVKIVFRDFPLSFHSEAKPAAMAAECADDQNMFWEYHDLLFENQASLGDDLYLELAEELGLDIGEFTDCVESETYSDEVDADLAEGQQYGVSGTPAFFINGKLVSGAQPYSVFEDEIESILAALEAEDSQETVEEKEEEMAVEETAGVDTEEVDTEVAPEEAAEVDTTNAVELTLDAKRWLFTPRELTVSADDVVSLTIEPDNLDFTFAIEGLGVEEDVSGTTTITFEADSTGEYTFSCSSCEDWRGMSGTLTVE